MFSGLAGKEKRSSEKILSKGQESLTFESRIGHVKPEEAGEQNILCSVT